MTAQILIAKGLRFRSVIADANCLFEVKDKEGRAWLCEVIPEPEPVEIAGQKFYGEYIGTQRVFTATEIRQAVGLASFFAERQVAVSQARDELMMLGATLHYHHGFGGYYRCEVVEHESDLKLKPVAMIGAWREYQTNGRVMHDGTISYPYETQRVLDGEPFEGRADSIYESGMFVAPRGPNAGVDPRTLDPIEITAPEITDTDREFAKVYTAVKAAEEALTARDNPDADKAELAATARAILAELDNPA